MSWLFDLLRAGSVPSPPPEPRFGMLLGTVFVLCSGILATACLRKRFLRALFRSIFLPGDAAARDAAALIRSLSNIDADGDDSANPALLELQRTEEDYVEDLRALAHAKAGLVSGGLLSAAKAELLFSNAPVLLALNEEFLATLNSSDSSPLLTGAQPSIDVVAAAFASLGPYFRLYAEYAKNYFRAIQTLQEIRAAEQSFRGGGARQVELRRQLAEVRGLRGANLDSLLIKPVQRLTKYPLLLRELLERLPDQHPYRAKLTAAAVEIAQTNAEVNARIERAEMAAPLLQAHEDLGGGVLAPNRTLRLMLDATCASPAHKAHRLYIFSDAALLASPRRTSIATAPRALAIGVSALLDRKEAPRRAFVARRWLPLDAVVASCDGAVLSLGELERPRAPPPEPPLALRCASEAAAAEAVAAIVAAQKDREDLLRSGCKATGAGLGT
jgi:hypothetical protein